jgi:hypothetical protein
MSEGTYAGSFLRHRLLRPGVGVVRSLLEWPQHQPCLPLLECRLPDSKSFVGQGASHSQVPA